MLKRFAPIFIAMLSAVSCLGFLEDVIDEEEREHIEDVTVVSDIEEIVVESITDANTVVYEGTEAAESINPGQIICSGPVDNAPRGYLYKVKSVTSEGGKTYVETEEASLEDFIEKGSASAEINVADYVESIVFADGETLEFEKTKALTLDSELKGTFKILLTPGKKPEITKMKDGEHLKDEDVIIAESSTIEAGASASGAIEVGFSFKSVLNFDLDIDDFKVNKCEISLEDKVDFHVNAVASLKGEVKLAHIPFFEMNLLPITIPVATPVGVYPLVFTPKLALYGDITVNGTVKLTAEIVNMNVDCKFGIECNDGNWGIINENNSKDPEFFNFRKFLKPELKGTLKVEPNLSFIPSFYNIDVDSTLSITCGVPFTATISELDHISPADDYYINPLLTVKCGLSVKPKLKLKILSYKLLDFHPELNLIEVDLCKKHFFPVLSEVTMSDISSVNASTAFTLSGFDDSFFRSFEDVGVVISEKSDPFPEKFQEGSRHVSLGTELKWDKKDESKDIDVKLLVDGLNPSSTYYVRPYFDTFLGTKYGHVQPLNTVFNTIHVTTLDSGDIMTTSARLKAVIEPGNGGPLTERGFLVSAEQPIPNYDTADKYIMEPGQDSYLIENLVPGTRYYVRAFATNAIGTVCGNVVTMYSGVDLLLDEIGGITWTTAKASLSATESEYLTTIGVVYAKGDAIPVVPGDHECVADKPGPEVSIALEGLEAGTEYSIRPYAHYAGNIVYGDTKKFKTPEYDAPTVITGTPVLLSNTTMMVPIDIEGFTDGVAVVGAVASNVEKVPTISNSIAFPAEKAAEHNEIILTLTNYDPSKTYYVRGYALVINGSHKEDFYGEVVKFGDGSPEEDTGKEWVDLGLSVKWATCNLGASKPEEYGDYYAWGATEPWYENGYAQEDPQKHWKSGKSEGYFWENTPFNGGSSSCDNSYWNAHKLECVDGNGVLLPENDAAHVQWGGSWRMPTHAEFQELIYNCTSEWTTLNGVNGRKFTSRENGNSIFLPAAGVRSIRKIAYFGSDGNYGSSSLMTGYPEYAYYLYFHSGNVMRNYSQRCFGRSVRPVYDEGQSGQAVISVSPEEVEFGKVYPGESATASFTITNSGTAAASVSIANLSDVITSDVSGDITIGAGASKTVTLTFTPKGKGSYGGSILVSCGGTNINVLYEGTCIEKNNSAPEAVDLGLSVKWASCNLGASKPEEYGGYYQWAGLEDVTSTSIYLDYSNCPYHTGSSSSTGWTKYLPSGQSSYWSGTGSPDNKTVLDPEDDVAHVKLGGKWRMPTEVEFQELIDNCTSELTTLNGVYGGKFTSKKNGNSIFLPAAGYRYDDGLDYAGSRGYCWASSRNTGSPSHACGMYFYYGDVGTSVDYRFYGRSVRPVSE